MTIEEALNIVDQALVPVVGTKQQLAILDQAVTVIKEHLKNSGTDLLKKWKEDDPAR